eukprot:gnl/TRDRNA2_/TRDRNA2_199249_c0_seq1.p1 gnl/TRDRNA2_/TRDRNA2_199249_c0~~gnl/TRDRNA2_/TRDRNA2_199249_c0_seq1.p1  ORF type:complete len:238 (-),score=58.41 gnl/TRDRNA2_/TRDRNA2_199249_c0_seq1:490-1203(-)
MFYGLKCWMRLVGCSPVESFVRDRRLRTRNEADDEGKRAWRDRNNVEMDKKRSWGQEEKSTWASGHKKKRKKQWSERPKLNKSGKDQTAFAEAGRIGVRKDWFWEGKPKPPKVKKLIEERYMVNEELLEFEEQLEQMEQVGAQTITRKEELAKLRAKVEELKKKRAVLEKKTGIKAGLRPGESKECCAASEGHEELANMPSDVITAPSAVLLGLFTFAMLRVHRTVSTVGKVPLLAA